MTSEETIRYIDKLIAVFKIKHFIDANAVIIFLKDNPELTKEVHPLGVLEEMCKLGLLIGYKTGVERTWNLTELGYRVLLNGDWSTYLKNKELLIVEQINSTIATNNNIIETNKTTKNILRLTTGIAVLTLMVTGSNLIIDCKGLQSKEQSGTETQDPQKLKPSSQLNPCDSTHLLQQANSDTTTIKKDSVSYKK